jgi:hypothetical protein
MGAYSNEGSLPCEILMDLILQRNKGVISFLRELYIS